MPNNSTGKYCVKNLRTKIPNNATQANEINEYALLRKIFKVRIYIFLITFVFSYVMYVNNEIRKQY